MEFYLSKIKSKDDLKALFIEKWNWDPPQISHTFLNLPEDIEKIVLESEIIAEKLGYYKVIFFSLDLKDPEKELRRIEKKIIVNKELRDHLDNYIFIFAADNLNYFDFVKADKVGYRVKLRRFSITPDNRNRLRTPSEQLMKLSLDYQKLDYVYISNKIEEAFSVEAVTEKFYREYMQVFDKIRKSLIGQNVNSDNNKMREFIHLVLNRIMFLYFVQKRGCFGGNKDFLSDFWDYYKSNFMGENKFHREWLNTLFFEGLSKANFDYKSKPSLGKFNDVLKNAPYLDGGLFNKNKELDEIGWFIPDYLFDDIFEFFESYNFTVEESKALDIDIAINPEMLGNIYEHLINAEEQKEQAKAGIFYTPKVEIELMIRRSLVEFLFNKTKIYKYKLYKFIFPEKEEEIIDPFTNEEAEKVLKELDDIFILDPACGSGHYLVVAAQILYELKEVLNKKLGKPIFNKYEAKKRIIERNIYGNDIKKWATEIAKLRLWLDLFVDAEDKVLKNQIEPILPNLNFKIRYGDSIVQRLGEEVIALRTIESSIESQRKELEMLIEEKKNVYKTGDPNKAKNILYLEKKLLLNDLEVKKIKIQKELQVINKDQENKQLNLLSQDIEEKQMLLFKKREKERKKALERFLIKIDNFIKILKQNDEIPMLWDLAFAEVFANKGGFDIVIANPPYVRQKSIEDLNGIYSKKEYKEQLIKQIIEDWKYNYEGKLRFGVRSPIPKKFDKKCDLYVYFYLKGLKLLNPDGVLCYITSNSWLDVGYGRILQEVLLKRCPIVAIYDNQAKRSFKQADVNTIIAVIKAPKEKDFDEEVIENEVKFVMFKKPFEEVMYSEVFIELENTNNLKQLPEGKRRETELYRLHVVNQKDLYEFGRDKNTGQYIGNKWGGKYLRAPEIYWVILEKGKNLFVRIKDVARVEGYIHGFNVGELFDKVYFIESIKTAKTIYLYKTSEGVILYGVKNKGNSRVVGDLLFPRMIGNRYLILMPVEEVYGQKFYKILFKDKRIKTIASMFLNSTIGILQTEINFVSLWGQGALSANSGDISKLYIPIFLDIPSYIVESFCNREIKSIFEELGFDPSKPIRQQEPDPLPDRKVIDDIVFDALGLTDKERKEVYWAVAELVKNRLEKARSV